MATNGQQLTEAQQHLIMSLDDVHEHMRMEFDPDEYRGFSTCGFAHIRLGGNSSFVRRVKSLADSGDIRVRSDRRTPDTYTIEVAGLELSLMKNHDSGYRLSISNISSFISGPEKQRMDVRERLHDLLLERLRHNEYCADSRRHSRMD